MPKSQERYSDWETFVRRDGPKIFRYFRARFDHHQSCDLVQEVLLRMIRKEAAGAYDSSQGTALTYALGIAHFVAREAYRKHSRLRESPIGEASAWSVAETDTEPSFDCYRNETAEESAMQTQEAEKLRAAIAQLPSDQQEILALLIERELSLQDIAAITNMPINTVKSHIHRAKGRLKAALQQGTLGAKPRSERNVDHDRL